MKQSPKTEYTLKKLNDRYVLVVYPFGQGTVLHKLSKDFQGQDHYKPVSLGDFYEMERFISSLAEEAK